MSPPGLLQLQATLTESTESLRLEAPGTHKRNLSEKAKSMLDNVKKCIVNLDE